MLFEFDTFAKSQILKSQQPLPTSQLQPPNSSPIYLRSSTMSLTVVLLEPRRVSIACIKSTKETWPVASCFHGKPWKLLLRAIIGYPFLIQQKGRCLTLVNLFTKACFVLSILHAVFILISYKRESSCFLAIFKQHLARVQGSRRIHTKLLQSFPQQQLLQLPCNLQDFAKNRWN